MNYTPREDRLITRCARRNSFATSARIRDELNFEGHVSVRTDNRRLNEPHKATHKMAAPVITSLAGLLELVTNHLRWNIRNWKRVHWLDKSRFLLRHVDGHVLVWWYRNIS
jgi:hypothetical protein